MKKRFVNLIIIIFIIIISSICFANISMEQINLDIDVQYVSSNPTNDLIVILDWKGNLFITDSSFKDLKFIDKNVEYGGDISHNGKLIAYVSNGILKIFDLSSFKIIRSKNVFDYTIYNICWSHNDCCLYLLCEIGEDSNSIICIDLSTMKQTIIMTSEDAWRYRYMATCQKIKNKLFLIGTLYYEDPVGAPRGIYQYDLITKNMSLIKIPKDQDSELFIDCMAISPSGKMIAYIKPYKIVGYSTISSNIVQISTLFGEFVCEIPIICEDFKNHIEWYTISWAKGNIYFVSDGKLYKIPFIENNNK